MSEYWKSTPKYWCKHCKTYVRDTAFERTQHEATGKHQGNLKRFLRDVHRSQDQEQKESQRAKNEVERLKGLVASSTQTGTQQQPPWKRSEKVLDSGSSASASVTREQRKRQMEQLAGMGVAIPDEFRPDMAMAGEWQTVSETLITDAPGNEQSSIVKGVRKRRLDEHEEEEEQAEGLGGLGETRPPKKAWGSAFKTHPANEENDDELEALLNLTTNVKEEKFKIEPKSEEISVKEEIQPETGLTPGTEIKTEGTVKREDSSQAISDILTTTEPSNIGDSAPTVLFKKRKPKQTKR